MYELERYLDFARRVSHTAGKLTLNYYQKSLEVIRKADNSPVTIADREAETYIRAEIEKAFPDHGIIGEEHGVKEARKGSAWRWVIDPIDGTKSFIHGVPLYTTLLGLLREDRSVVGIIEVPALGDQLAAAEGLGCHLNVKPVRVSKVSQLSEAVVLTTDMNHLVMMFPDGRWRPLLEKCLFARTWGDAYGYYLVATGRAEVMIDPQVAPHDVAGLPVILREAGGHYFDWTGAENVFGGNGAATNDALCDLVKRTLTTKA